MKDPRVKYISDKIEENTPPDELSDLTQDATHRTVTDTEKSTWNAKSNFDGNFYSLINRSQIIIFTYTL